MKLISGRLWGRRAIISLIYLVAIMKNTGIAHMGVGRASGEKRADEAVKGNGSTIRYYGCNGTTLVGK